MKRLLWFITFILVTYAIYYDLSVGTINNQLNISHEEDFSSINSPKLNYQAYRVQEGDTVLSIVKEMNDVTPSVSIIIEDFKYLNPDTEVYEIHPNVTYEFPIYHDSNHE
ncbi:hypothetical protein LC087_07585 [Bacillus carboniphilus]|uniref:LysM domain-containing protein n=1 Tax=Bacillus carboniphilus TaxID=86663 RepID=A0ABY9JYV4_9BACI|nr:hypothetical protein [Bacillus carboniphilus]WLR43958.1 hypothetical protein LC087_07585 [Bacillus carboniphilus]